MSKCTLPLVETFCARLSTFNTKFRQDFDVRMNLDELFPIQEKCTWSAEPFFSLHAEKKAHCVRSAHSKQMSPV